MFGIPFYIEHPGLFIMPAFVDADMDAEYN
jgi:hypothetical protein